MTLGITSGEFVISNTGKDKGKCFIVLSVEKQFLYLCNGKNRRMSCPKKKKAVHVIAAGAFDKSLAEAIADGSVTDKKIRRSISAYKGNRRAESIIIKK